MMTLIQLCAFAAPALLILSVCAYLEQYTFRRRMNERLKGAV